MMITFSILFCLFVACSAQVLYCHDTKDACDKKEKTSDIWAIYSYPMVFGAKNCVKGELFYFYSKCENMRKAELFNCTSDKCDDCDSIGTYGSCSEKGTLGFNNNTALTYCRVSGCNPGDIGTILFIVGVACILIGGCTFCFAPCLCPIGLILLGVVLCMAFGLF